MKNEMYNEQYLVNGKDISSTISFIEVKLFLP